MVPTDLSVALPEGSYGRVAPRSGLAVKHFIDVGAGVIDADYRGPVGVLLFNFGDSDFQVYYQLLKLANHVVMDAFLNANHSKNKDLREWKYSRRSDA